LSVFLAITGRGVIKMMVTKSICQRVLPRSHWPLTHRGKHRNGQTRPVTMVVPTAAGGGADILGRTLARRLSEILGQPVIIENVGNAVAATNRIAKGMPDGYHFNLGGTAHLAFHPTIYKTPVYNSRIDFAPVALVVEQPFLLVTRLDFPAKNLQEFIAYTKANQGKLQYGSGAGTGSGNHLSCEMLNSAIGVKVTHRGERN
jgi:tripartite-type tricarboxylate transporter receptor subunit TctC